MALKAAILASRTVEKVVKAAWKEALSWRYTPAVSSNRVSNTVNTCAKEPPDCANPPNPNRNTAHLECAVSTSIFGKDAICDVTLVYEPNISLNMPSHLPIYKTQSLLARLKKLPHAATRAFLVKDTPHNLVTISKLVDTRCSAHMYFWSFDIDYKGETIYKGWREREARTSSE